MSQQAETEKPTASKPSALQQCVTACCCLQIRERDDVNVWMMSSEEKPLPSLFQRLCFWQCGRSERVASGIENVPELRGLAGVSVQNGHHDTRGSLQTLRWAKWDAEKRQAEMKVFGGFTGFCGGKGTELGQWTEPVVPKWLCLTNLARLGKYTYRFNFTEDYRKADIQIRIDPLVLCCICIPCMPAWCSVPKGCVAFDMVQSSESTDGSEWIRRNMKCGGEPEHAYSLQEVFDVDGAPGKYHQHLEITPQLVMVSV